jgi:hypothetical protein
MKSNTTAPFYTERVTTLFVCDSCGRRVRLFSRALDPAGLPRRWMQDGDRHYCDAGCGTVPSELIALRRCFEAMKMTNHDELSDDGKAKWKDAFYGAAMVLEREVKP